MAKDQAHDRIQFYQSSRADQPLLSAAPVLPGASLYLIDRRLPVSVNLRWMLQCVVFAKGAADGGASASFLADLNSGRLSATRDVVDCANYIHDSRDTQAVKLHVWLRRAKFLFTQVPSRNLHPLQVSADVYASIARAIAQLPVLGIPDLTCVSAPEGWQQNTFARQNALANLNRFRNTALNFDVQAQTTSIDTTQRIFADAGNSSVYEQVLQFLVKGTTRAGKPWTAEYPVTLQELETAGVLENMHIYEKLVAPGDMYPRFRYANLAKLDILYRQTQQTQIEHTLATYTLDDTQQRCKCTKEQQDKLKTLCEHRLLLRKPEYSLLNKVRCQDLRLLPCKAQGVERLLDDRRWMDTPFLAQDELLYLVLLIFQYEISYTASGGFTTLHRLRDPEQAQFVDELFGDTLPENDQLSLHEARQFNEYLERHDAGTTASADGARLLPGDEQAPPAAAPVPRRAARADRVGAAERPHAHAPAAERDAAGRLLPGAHGARRRDLPRHALRHQLDDGRPHLARARHLQRAPGGHRGHGALLGRVLRRRERRQRRRALARLRLRARERGQHPHGVRHAVLEQRRQPAARATCSEHPVYKDRLENLLPAVCAQQDGRVVARRRLGALKKGRLCDMRPDGLDAACRLRHGALNGHVGEHASNLDEAQALGTTQRGFWNPANTAFRGQAVSADALTALALNEDDIAGHCLAFDLDARGTLALRGAALGASCSPTPQAPTSAPGSPTSGRSGPGTTRSPPPSTRTTRASPPPPTCPGPAPSTGSSATTTTTAATRRAAPPGSATAPASATSQASTSTPTPPSATPAASAASAPRASSPTASPASPPPSTATAQSSSTAPSPTPSTPPGAPSPTSPQTNPSAPAPSTGPPTAARPRPTATRSSPASVCSETDGNSDRVF